MDPQNSTLIQALLGDLSTASTTWYSSILPYAKTIFFTLVGFQLLWTCITFAIGKRQGDEFISMLFIMVIDVGFFYALILHPEWILQVINSFRQIGSEASNLTTLSPDAVLDTGLRLASSMIQTISLTGLFDFLLAAFLAAFVALAILASFAFIAARMVLVLAEIFFAVNISPLLLAFSGLSATKYIATQYIGYVISAGIQLLVMYLLVGAGLELSTTWSQIITQHGATDVNAFMLVGVTATLYSVLVWNLPKLVSGLASGAPQMISGGYSAAATGYRSAASATQSIPRGFANMVEGLGRASLATSQNVAARNAAGKSLTMATVGGLTSLTASSALTGVNSLLGRYNRPTVTDRLQSSTAKQKAKAPPSNTPSQTP